MNLIKKFSGAKKDATKETYVKIWIPGLIGYSTYVSEVKNRSIENLDLPSNAWSFQFFDIIKTNVETNGEKIEVSSDPVNFSDQYYVAKRVISLEEFMERNKADFPNIEFSTRRNRENMIDEMKRKGIQKALEFNEGMGFSPLPEGTKYILVNNGEITGKNL